MIDLNESLSSALSAIMAQLLDEQGRALAEIYAAMVLP